MTLKKFIYRILLFSSIIMAIAYVLFSFFINKFYLPVFPFLILFFVVSTIAIHAILIHAGKQRPARFSTFFMGSVSSKLFLYLIFIVIYVFADKQNAVIFLITFFILYLCYTVFETYSLVKDFKNVDTKKTVE